MGNTQGSRGAPTFLLPARDGGVGLSCIKVEYVSDALLRKPPKERSIPVNSKHAKRIAMGSVRRREQAPDHQSAKTLLVAAPHS